MRALPATAALLLGITVSGRAIAQFVVPPGQEGLVAEMLGRGELLPGACRLVEVKMEPATIHASYECEGAPPPAIVTLAHLPGADPVFSTSQFAVTASREVPEALRDALRNRITAREASWRWADASEELSPGSPRARSRWPWLAFIASYVVLLVIVVARIPRARRSSR